MNQRLIPFAALPFQIQTITQVAVLQTMAGNRSWTRSSWSDSPWQDNNNPSWNNWGRQQAPSQPVQPSVPANSVPIPQNFHPDSECFETSVVSGKKLYRNIQSTSWSSKSGLAGKDVGQLRLVDLTRKGLDDNALGNLSKGKFQSVVCAISVSEAVFTTSLLRLIRQERLDIDGIAAGRHKQPTQREHLRMPQLHYYLYPSRLLLRPPSPKQLQTSHFLFLRAQPKMPWTSGSKPTRHTSKGKL